MILLPSSFHSSLIPCSFPSFIPLLFFSLSLPLCFLLSFSFLYFLQFSHSSLISSFSSFQYLLKYCYVPDTMEVTRDANVLAYEELPLSLWGTYINLLLVIFNHEISSSFIHCLFRHHFVYPLLLSFPCAWRIYAKVLGVPGWIYSVSYAWKWQLDRI